MKRLFLISAVLLVPLFVFAGGNNQQGSPAAGSAPAQTSGTAGGAVSYPLNTDVTLTYWVELTANLRPNFVNMGETPFAQTWQERTGVKLEFLHPASNAGAEQFNLMIASREFPDIIDRNWLNYPGGPEKAIGDEVIIPLNDAFNKYAPNLTGFLKANPRFDRMVKTDERNYYVFPFLRGDDGLCIFNGIYIRKDWLDELGLQVPETFDDWHTVLTAFKEKKNIASPLCIPMTNPNFVRGFGIDREFYLGDDGKVHYGAIEAPFRNYLETMARWYREGLLDRDAASITAAQINTKMSSGAAGAGTGNLGASMGTWVNAGRATNPAYTLVATKPPVVRRGDPIVQTIDNNYTGNGGCAITTANRNVEITARMFDWGYSDAGYLYHNFGVEGKTYTMVNGKPTYTDLIMKNPDGWPVAHALSANARASYNGPFIQSIIYQQQFFALPEQNAAVELWTQPEPFKNKLPPISPSQDESREFATIMGDINTYANEMIVKFILGTEPLSGFDTFVSTIRRMGMDRALEIQTSALARYNQR